MRSVRSVLFALVVVAVCARGAGAQETRKVGVTMGYPASVGLIWHASDKVAIRPELSFSGSSSETESTDGLFQLEGDGWALGTGVSALFYLHTYDRVRTYISPRFTYTRTTTDTTTSGPVVIAGTITSKTTAVGGTGSFGAQYAPADRFSVFGEVGFGYTHTSSSSSRSIVEPKGNSWGTRAGVGVVFYF